MKKNSKKPLINEETNDKKHQANYQNENFDQAELSEKQNIETSENFDHDQQAKKNGDDKDKKNDKKIDKHKAIISDLKTENSELQKQIINLQSQNIAIKIENQKNIHDFQIKAKEFQHKAQIEVNKIKENLHQKMLEEKATIEKYTLQKFLENILQPFTYLMTAINIGQNIEDNNVRAYVAGFTMYIRQLIDEFKHFGVSEIKPQIGDQFDEQIHKISETIDGHEKNKIVKIIQNGFKLHDRVLIPAIVTVGK